VYSNGLLAVKWPVCRNGNKNPDAFSGLVGSREWRGTRGAVARFALLGSVTVILISVPRFEGAATTFLSTAVHWKFMTKPDNETAGDFYGFPVHMSACKPIDFEGFWFCNSREAEATIPFLPLSF